MNDKECVITIYLTPLVSFAFGVQFFTSSLSVTTLFLFQALLAETERLAQDRLDLQRQAEKDHSSMSLRLRVLERELEEQETKGLETEQHHKSHTEDLNQQVQALEKQLKHDRQFIEVSFLALNKI